VLLREAVFNRDAVIAEKCKRSFYYFMHQFWDCVSADTVHWNWHIELLTQELETVARNVAEKKPKLHDLIINIPPGTTKSITCSVMFPVWCWTNWSWMRFICGSYSAALSLDHAELSRDLVRSDKYKRLFPHLDIKQDKDTKSNFRIQETLEDGTVTLGGNRYTTSVGGTLTGFHGHILLVDDPLNPKEAISDTKVKAANHWMEQTLSTRKVDKAITPTILIMQRLHQNDPTGHWLDKKKENVRHICLPGEIKNYKQYVKPVELIDKYENKLLDPVRMPWIVLKDMEMDLGQYGYAGQIGQNPTPPAGGMFKVDFFQIIDTPPATPDIVETIRYWDKAATKDGGAYSCGVKMSRLKNNKMLIWDVKRGQWATEMRENHIRKTAEADGNRVQVYHEQEPGSGGKESAQATTRNLIGFVSTADKPTGDKIFRADPYSVQVNNGNVMLMRGDWNTAFIEEHRFFPFGTLKDQVDASSGAFNKLAAKRTVRNLLN